jgi:hypothetical protein
MINDERRGIPGGSTIVRTAPPLPTTRVSGGGGHEAPENNKGPRRGTPERSLISEGFGAGITALNPPFDSRITNIGGANPSLSNRNLRRGGLVSSTPRKAGGSLDAVRFLFNPPVVNVGFTMSGDVPPPNDAQDGDLTRQTQPGPTYDKNTTPGTEAADGQQPTKPTYIAEGSVSLSVVFDRTFEVNARTAFPESRLGAHIDVLAFYCYLQMIPEMPEYGALETWVYPSFPMMFRTGFLYIGGDVGALRYYGYATSLGVTYTQFSYDMIPTRAEVAIEYVTRSYVTTKEETGDTGGGSQPSQPKSKPVPPPLFKPFPGGPT